MHIKQQKWLFLILFFCFLSTFSLAERTLTIFNQETEPLDIDQRDDYKIQIFINNAPPIENNGFIPYGGSATFTAPDGPFFLKIDYFSIKNFPATVIFIFPGPDKGHICKAIDAYVGGEYRPKNMAQFPCPH